MLFPQFLLYSKDWWDEVHEQLPVGSGECSRDAHLLATDKSPMRLWGCHIGRGPLAVTGGRWKGAYWWQSSWRTCPSAFVTSWPPEHHHPAPELQLIHDSFHLHVWNVTLHEALQKQDHVIRENKLFINISVWNRFEIFYFLSTRNTYKCNPSFIYKLTIFGIFSCILHEHEFVLYRTYMFSLYSAGIICILVKPVSIIH